MATSARERLTGLRVLGERCGEARRYWPESTLEPPGSDLPLPSPANPAPPPWSIGPPPPTDDAPVFELLELDLLGFVVVVFVLVDVVDCPPAKPGESVVGAFVVVFVVEAFLDFFFFVSGRRLTSFVPPWLFPTPKSTTFACPTVVEFEAGSSAVAEVVGPGDTDRRSGARAR
jgi:hypothetical protein